MIHKVKYGWVEVVLVGQHYDRRAPDLTFKGAEDRKFVVFFAPASTTEGAEMQSRYYAHLEVIGDAIIDELEEQDDETL